MDFIFMLTRNDRTVEDAMDHLAVAQRLGIAHIGFKDIGLPFDRLRELSDAIRGSGATSYLEVVSLDRASEIASARAGATIGVDVLLGGTHPADVLPILAGTGIRYYPFPGQVTGHPSVLHGPAEDIIASARALADLEGVHGLDLLAWRYDSEVEALIAGVCGAVRKPVIVAGSIDRPGRIAAAARAGAAGFTIGTAALDGAFAPLGSAVGNPDPGDGAGLETQLRAILAAMRARAPVR